MSDYTFSQLAAAVVDAVREMPMQPRKIAHKTETSYTLAVLRPYIEAAVTGVLPKSIRDQQDKREKPWLVSLELWHGEPGKLKRIASSDRRAYGEDGNAAEYGGEVLRGLDAVARYVVEGCLEYGAPEDFSFGEMQRAFRYLRSSISLGKGHATMRRTSKDGCWYLVCDVFKEGSFPNE